MDALSIQKSLAFISNPPSSYIESLPAQAKEVQGVLPIPQTLQLPTPAESLHFTREQCERFEICKADKFLNKRFIAHLFGDSFMQDSIYEGWFVTDAILHMIAILQDNEISPEVSAIIKDLKTCLAWQERMIAFSIANESSNVDDAIDSEEEILDDELSEVEDSTCADDQDAIKVVETSENESSPLKRIVGEFQEAICNLQPGQKIVVPGGCRGHSVLYEIKRQSKDEFEFCVYNTGAGVEKHNIIFEDEGAEKVYGAYRVTQIDQEHILNEKFLSNLFSLTREVADDFGEQLYEQMLPTLNGAKASCSTNADDFMLIQRSGTCTWKMFSAYLRYNLPLIQRKYIKLKSRLDVFQKWYDLGYSLDTVQISQKLLSRLIVNYKGEIFKKGHLPINFSREELLTLGIYKVKKTFDKYKFLLDDAAIEKADTWYKAFTGQSIYAA